MVFEIILSLLISIAVSLVVGLFLIPALRRINVGQKIRDDGPVWHNKKQGTPILGGLIFISGITAVCLTIGLPRIIEGDFTHLFLLLFALVFGLIGFYDDLMKLRRKQNLGLKVLPKFALQTAVAVGFLILMRHSGYLTSDLYIPFINTTISIPEPLYFVFAAFVIVGTVNSVNITDGVDGLVTGVTIPVAACFAILCTLWGFGAIGIFTFALLGGLITFLFFNFHPAKIFMGDTGSLFLGGAICAIAFAMDMPLILLPLGFVYFVETLSDIIQIFYFKLSGGKRVFKMAPLHHHFEMSGWSEYKLFIVFTSTSIVFAVISFFGVVNRF
jgi:phospho-N-acetylmuramoyl-pentapeptide-transferase